MRKNPPTVSPLDNVSLVVDRMMKENIGAIVVEEDNRPIGVITEKDLLRRVVNPEREYESIQARDIMSQPVISIDSNSPIRDALELLRKHDIRRLVVTEAGFLVGLTTERRILEIAHEQYIIENAGRINRVLSDDGIKINVGYVSTFPPRQCGIATYTYDVVSAISRLYVTGSPSILAINDKGGYYDYSNLVKYQIDREDSENFKKAAEYVNKSEIDIVNLQHEYGLLGGIWGDNVINFLDKLEKPVVTTLHTLLPKPSEDAKRVMEYFLEKSDYIIIMAKVGMAILENNYDTLANNVRYIPHGCPNVPFISSESMKGILGLKGRKVLSTFGLLSRGKGMEYAIQSLPNIVEETPEVLYLIIGQTHPEVRKHEGESYRQYLMDLVDKLGLNENVRFVNRFVEKNELIRFLQATDVYIIPYPNRDQISSGTMLYALSTGKAIITTPFLHAEEVISQGGAMRCEFRSPESIADAVETLFTDGSLHEEYQKRAYEYSRDMIWPNVAMMYVNLLFETLGM
jgi:glycosyltransferase involved in cell wall biosynthesis